MWRIFLYKVLQKVCLGNVNRRVVDFPSPANNLGYSTGGWLIQNLLATFWVARRVTLDFKIYDCHFLVLLVYDKTQVHVLSLYSILCNLHMKEL